MPVLQHPGNFLVDQGSEELKAEEFLLNPEDMESYYDPELLMTSQIQAAIDGSHANG